MELWILCKMNLWNCEFCQKWDFQNVNFWIDCGFLPQCGVLGIFHVMEYFWDYQYVIFTSFWRTFKNFCAVYFFKKARRQFSKIALLAFFLQTLKSASKNEFQVGYSDSIKEGIDVKGFRLWRHSTQEKKPKKQQRTRQEHYRLLSKSSKDLGKLQCSKSSIL